MRWSVKWPTSANHGGILRAATEVFMAFAHGRADSYVSSDIGATSPGRWHCWQFFWRIGSTSLLNVGAVAAGGAASATRVVNVAERSAASVFKKSLLSKP